VSVAAAAGAGEGALDAARKAFRGASGPAVLDALGWWELLADAADPEARAAALALFHAQGLELGDTCALGALLASPYRDAAQVGGRVAATVRRRSTRGEARDVVLGDPAVDFLLLDAPGAGARVVPLDEVELRRIDVPGRLTIHEVVATGRDLATIAEDAARAARPRSLFLGRIAVAFEILGAAEAVLALAVDYACTRVQFDAPIASFQAVRHLLAWARTDCAAIEAIARTARDLDAQAPPHHDAIAKALAGRNGKRACERALQVLGAIGFTAEHVHHHLHGRVLLLDAVLGSSFELTHQLGSWLRETQDDPAIADTLLAVLP
jgi:hypothetical protein